MTDISAQFRVAMRRVASTVNVLTATVDGVPVGMTATAFASLAADPPSLLVCVNQSASFHDPLTRAKHFCVNVLHTDQVEIARTFSDSRLRDVRFATGGWRYDAAGAPYLPDAQAVLICERTELIGFATHSICIGTVVSIRMREEIDPLLYVDGAFHAVAESRL